MEYQHPLPVGLWFGDIENPDAFKNAVRMCAKISAQIFGSTGSHPFVHYVFCRQDPNTKRRLPVIYMVPPPPCDLTPAIKDLMAQIVAMTCEFGDAPAYVMAAEMWWVEADKTEVAEIMAAARKSELHKHPRRIEVLGLIAHHRNQRSFTTYAPIIRTDGLAPKLGEWVTTDYHKTEGRFAHLTVGKPLGSA